MHSLLDTASLKFLKICAFFSGMLVGHHFFISCTWDSRRKWTSTD